MLVGTGMESPVMGLYGMRQVTWAVKGRPQIPLRRLTAIPAAAVAHNEGEIVRSTLLQDAEVHVGLTGKEDEGTLHGRSFKGGRCKRFSNCIGRRSKAGARYAANLKRFSSSQA